MKLVCVLFFSILFTFANSEVYFIDDLADGGKFVKSTHNKDTSDSMDVVERGNDKKMFCLKTSKGSKFYHYGAKTDKVFDTKGKTVVFQYVLQHEQDLTCGGGYVKLLLTSDVESYTDQSDYSIMFGPDACGGTRRIHFILSHKGKNVLKTNDISYTLDKMMHVYTLVIHPDKKYEIKVDGKEQAKGVIEEDFELFGKAMIDDKDEKKPSDWVDESEIDDVTDKKPEDWDKPETILDEDAVKPDGWDDEIDGDWVKPQIANPDYKGEWSAKKIPNPEYKGEWKPKQIKNPDYVYDESHSEYSIKAIGIDVWQVEAGSLYCGLLLTDDVTFAEKQATELMEIAESINEEVKKAQKEADEKMKAEMEKNKSENKEDDNDENDDKDEL